MLNLLLAACQKKYPNPPATNFQGQERKKKGDLGTRQFIVVQEEYMYNLKQSRVHFKKQTRLLSVVLVATCAKSAGIGRRLVWITPFVAVRTPVYIVTVVVVASIFKVYTVSEALLWDAAARFFHSPVARG